MFMLLKSFIDYYLSSLGSIMLEKLIIPLIVLLSMIPTLYVYESNNVTNTIWIIYMYIPDVFIIRIEKLFFKIIKC